MSDQQTIQKRVQEMHAELERLAEQAGLAPVAIRTFMVVDEFTGKDQPSGMLTEGKGNWYAQMGAIDAWLRSKKAYEAGWDQAAGEAEFDQRQEGDDDWKG